MSTPARTYARVYHEIVDDPKFARVYGNDAALGTWLRMLLVADAVYPQSAPLPRRNSSVTLLLEVGLIEERPGNRYAVHGLKAERERRSASSRIGAGVRWHSEGNANAMPSKAKQSKAEQIGANAPENRPLTEAERDAALQENMRLMNDPKVESHIRRAAEKTVARLKEGRAAS